MGRTPAPTSRRAVETGAGVGDDCARDSADEQTLFTAVNKSFLLGHIFQACMMVGIGHGVALWTDFSTGYEVIGTKLLRAFDDK